MDICTIETNYFCVENQILLKRAMNNFVYQNPVKIIFGKGEIANLSQYLPETAKIMFIYGGGSIKSNGIYDSVIKSLQGFDYVEFGGVEPNPKYETLLKAIELGRKEGVNFLLPVGGGSVIDGTKFIAAALPISNDPWEIIQRKVKIEKAIPIGAVLTIPATGTEMNGNAVISRLSTKEKYAFSSPLVMPQFSILDPEVCYSLPKKQIANGIVDAYMHTIEQYLTYPVNAMVQDSYAESLLKILIELAPKILNDQSNYDYCANFMWTATMALNGLIGCGVPQDFSTHQIGHELTALHGLDHAQTLAIVLPGVMNVKRVNKKDKILQYAEKVWNITSGSDDEKINKAIEKTDLFFQSTGTKTRLSDYGIGEETVDIVAKRFETRGFQPGERQDTTPDEIRAILQDRL